MRNSLFFVIWPCVFLSHSSLTVPFDGIYGPLNLHQNHYFVLYTINIDVFFIFHLIKYIAYQI